MNNDLEMYVINFSRVNSNSSFSNKSEDDLCSICYIEREDEKYEFWECIHKYHLDCAKEWIIKKATCPLCRNNKLNNNYYEMVKPDLDYRNHPVNRKKLMIIFCIYLKVTIILYMILICNAENIEKFNNCPFTS